MLNLIRKSCDGPKPWSRGWLIRLGDLQTSCHIPSWRTKSLVVRLKSQRRLLPSSTWSTGIALWVPNEKMSWDFVLRQIRFMAIISFSPVRKRWSSCSRCACTSSQLCWTLRSVRWTVATKAAHAGRLVIGTPAWTADMISRIACWYGNIQASSKEGWERSASRLKIVIFARNDRW